MRTGDTLRRVTERSPPDSSVKILKPELHFAAECEPRLILGQDSSRVSNSASSGGAASCHCHGQFDVSGAAWLSSTVS